MVLCTFVGFNAAAYVGSLLFARNGYEKGALVFVSSMTGLLLGMVGDGFLLAYIIKRSW